MRRFIQHTGKAVKQINNRIRHAFRGTLSFSQTNGQMQRAQVSGLADEQLDNIEMMQQFGFSSRPPAGTQVVVLPINGETSHSVIIATENGQFRVKTLQSGEVAIYDQSGSTIILKQGKVIDIQCDELVINCKRYQVNATEQAQFSTPTLNTSAKLHAQGEINSNSDVKAKGISLTNHTHRESGGKMTQKPQ